MNPIISKLLNYLILPSINALNYIKVFNTHPISQFVLYNQILKWPYVLFQKVNLSYADFGQFNTFIIDLEYNKKIDLINLKILSQN